MAPPRVSVIIPAYRAERTLPATLAALDRQTVPRAHFEVIVVDDGSPDRTPELAEKAGARVLRQANAGPAAARNRGAREAAGEVLVFTDSDCEPEADFLERLLAPLADPAVAATKGAYFSRQREVVARFVQVEYEEKYDRMAALQAREGGIDFVDTYALAVRRADFEAAGGFDAAFPSASVEDQEFGFRLAAAGRRMRFVPEARVWHTHAASLAGYARKKWKIGYWKVAVLRRHPGKAVRDSHTPQSLKLQMLLAPLPPLFLLATLPFVARALRRDPLVALAAPFLLYVRAVALGLGLAWGLATGVRLPESAPEPAAEQVAP
ncbi:MAG TPA: glycosyltransferase [Planctomycetota bacterium]|nr:glycosyltransferase [Planctomycetota bacterium]